MAATSRNRMYDLSFASLFFRVRLKVFAKRKERTISFAPLVLESLNPSARYAWWSQTGTFARLSHHIEFTYA